MNNEKIETNNARVIGRASECGRCAELEAELETIKKLSGTVVSILQKGGETLAKRNNELQIENEKLQKEIESLKRKAVGRQIRRNGLF